MKRLVFLVEGDTEVIFVHRLVIPYLYRLGFSNPMNAQKILTNRKLNQKGGNVNYQYLRNDIQRTLAQGNVIVTTLLDFFRLPTTFPGYTTNSDQIAIIENKMAAEFNAPSDFIPYIQRHEIEALMFCALDGFEIVVDDARCLQQLQNIITAYPNPEDINSSPDKAPSKRLAALFHYDKIIDGEMIMEAVGVDKMLEKCPHFSQWMEKIISTLRSNDYS